MKKLLSMVLCLCMLIAAFNITVFATDEISTFGIMMSGFKGGGKQEDVKFTVSDDRLEISEVLWIGTMEEDGTFKNQVSYVLNVTVKIKRGIDAKYLKDLSVDALQYSGIKKANKVTMESNLRAVKLYFVLKLSDTEASASKAEDEAAKHKHCYCGGHINVGDHTSHETVTFRGWDGKSKIPYC